MRSFEVRPWMLLLAGALHVAEEGCFGWIAWTRTFIPGVTWLHFAVGNGAFLLFLALAPLGGRRWPALGLAAPWLLLVNSLVHLGPTLVTGRWSPGLATALGLYLPLGVGGLVHARRGGVPPAVMARGAALAVGLMALPFLVQALRLAFS